MMSSNRISAVASTVARRFKFFDSSSKSFLATAHRSLSTAPQESFNDMQVVIDRYNSSPALAADAIPDRLPNDAQDRSDLYFDEDSREMAGVVASIRNNWTKPEIAEIYSLPFHELMYKASTVHRMYWDPSEVQQCTLLSIKTGGCTEDCSYCSNQLATRLLLSLLPP